MNLRIVTILITGLALIAAVALPMLASVIEGGGILDYMWFCLWIVPLVVTFIIAIGIRHTIPSLILLAFTVVYSCMYAWVAYHIFIDTRWFDDTPAFGVIVFVLYFTGLAPFIFGFVVLPTMISVWTGALIFEFVLRQEGDILPEP